MFTYNAEESGFDISKIDIEHESDLQRKAALIQYFAQRSRLEVFEMIHKRGNGHWGGSSSCAEILFTLYYHIMKVYPDHPRREDRDRLILSKGHAAPMLYNILAHKGFFPLDELAEFRTLNSRLQGHPCMLKTPGVDLSTGPLGHGISVAVGMALAAQTGKQKYYTFAVVGEGCLNEGQSWEALMTVAKFKPPRLVIMVDYNKVQLDGSSDEIMPLDSLADKFRAFNLKVGPVMYDGHKVSDIMESWKWTLENREQPCVIIYRTHKGKGISFTEDDHQWHGCPINDEAFAAGKKELEENLNKYLHEII